MNIFDILNKSFEDFKRVIRNPAVLILFTTIAVLAEIPSIITKTMPAKSIVIIPIMLLFMAIILYTSIIQIKLIKESVEFGQRDYSLLNDIGKKYLRLAARTALIILIFVLIFMGLFIPMMLILPALHLLSYASVTIAALVALLITVLIFGVLIINYAIYPYLIVIENERHPLRRSKELTKGKFWQITLLYTILIIIALPLVAMLYFLIGGLKINETQASFMMIPLNVVYSILFSIVYYNMYTALKKESSDETEVEEQRD